jgi:hypothetical protein
MKIIGIDNGVTGAIAVYDTEEQTMQVYALPIKKDLSYTKKAQNITRVDFDKLGELFVEIKRGSEHYRAFMERPATINNFKVVASSFRCLEAVLICLECSEIPHEFITSSDWQKPMLPKGIRGSKELKQASLSIALRNYPQMKAVVNKQNADAVNIAHYYGTKKAV